MEINYYDHHGSCIGGQTRRAWLISYPAPMHLTKDQGHPSGSAFSTFPYEARFYLSVSKKGKAELKSSGGPAARKPYASLVLK